LRLAFQDLYTQPLDHAKTYLDRWYFWATHSRIQPMIAGGAARYADRPVTSDVRSHSSCPAKYCHALRLRLPIHLNASRSTMPALF
jgi:hypothetical protein